MGAGRYIAGKEAARRVYEHGGPPPPPAIAMLPEYFLELQKLVKAGGISLAMQKARDEAAELKRLQHVGTTKQPKLFVDAKDVKSPGHLKEMQMEVMRETGENLQIKR